MIRGLALLLCLGFLFAPKHLCAGQSPCEDVCCENESVAIQAADSCCQELFSPTGIESASCCLEMETDLEIWSVASPVSRPLLTLIPFSYLKISEPGRILNLGPEFRLNACLPTGPPLLLQSGNLRC